MEVAPVMPPGQNKCLTKILSVWLFKTCHFLFLEELGHNANGVSTKGFQKAIKINAFVQMHFLGGAIGLENIRQVQNGTRMAAVHLK
jgi:hypothetical protein